MSDGQFVVPIVTDGGQVTGWARGAYLVHDAAHHRELGTDLRFLRYADGSVYEISTEAKNAIRAADQKAIDDEAARVEQQRLDDLAAAAQAAIDAETAPFIIDRMKLYNAVKAVGKAAELRAFIAADEDRLFTWNTAKELDSDNQMVVDAMPWFQSLLPEGCTVRDFLLTCRV
jgi:hypothetical protein